MSEQVATDTEKQFMLELVWWWSKNSYKLCRLSIPFQISEPPGAQSVQEGDATGLWYLFEIGTLILEQYRDLHHQSEVFAYHCFSE